MTNRNYFLALFACLLFLTSCDEDTVTPTGTNPPTSNSKNIIMPLGASRVEGARPVFESYRFELWKLLIDGGFDFDYIGTQEDESNYPEYANSTFDADHEGRGGWTSGQILNGIEGWINAAGVPDIVLFSSPGGNDGLEGMSFSEAISNVNAVIDIIQLANPNVTIVIEQMAPGHSDVMTPELTDFFLQMQQAVLDIADEQTTSTSRVLTVDMASGFNDSYLADDVHYSVEGAKFIAEKYYSVLTGVLD